MPFVEFAREDGTLIGRREVTYIERREILAGVDATRRFVKPDGTVVIVNRRKDGTEWTGCSRRSETRASF